MSGTFGGGAESTITNDALGPGGGWVPPAGPTGAAAGSGRCGMAVDEGVAALAALLGITAVIVLQPLETTVAGVPMNWVAVAVIALAGYAGIIK